MLRSPSLSPFPRSDECSHGCERNGRRRHRSRRHHHCHDGDDDEDGFEHEDVHHVVDVIEDLTRACLAEAEYDDDDCSASLSPRPRRRDDQDDALGIRDVNGAALSDGHDGDAAASRTIDLPLIEFSSSSEHLPAQKNTPTSVSGPGIPCDSPSAAETQRAEEHAALDVAESEASASSRERRVGRQDSKVVLVTKV